jgi:hypothetical protein
MNLMIPEAVARLTPKPTLADDTADILSFAIGACPLGQVLVARSVKGVCAILIGADQGALQADLAARFPHAQLVANEAAVQEDLAKVIRFVESPAEGLHLAAASGSGCVQSRSEGW